MSGLMEQLLEEVLEEAQETAEALGFELERLRARDAVNVLKVAGYDAAKARVAELEEEKELEFKLGNQYRRKCIKVEAERDEARAERELLWDALVPFASIGEGLERTLHSDAVETIKSGQLGRHTRFSASKCQEVAPLLHLRLFFQALDAAAKVRSVPVARCYRRFVEEGTRCVLRIAHEPGCQTTFGGNDDPEVAVGRSWDPDLPAAADAPPSKEEGDDE